LTRACTVTLVQLVEPLKSRAFSLPALVWRSTCEPSEATVQVPPGTSTNRGRTGLEGVTELGAALAAGAERDRGKPSA
jgi:hypothetical protein